MNQLLFQEKSISRIKFNLLFFILIWAMVWISCKKDEPDGPKINIPLISTITIDAGVFTSFDSFKYDNRGRRIYSSSKMTYNNTTNYYQTFYTYSGSSFTDESYRNGVKQSGTVYYLNNQGLCDYFRRGDETDTFKYNPDNFRISKIINSPSFKMVSFNTVENENTVRLQATSTAAGGSVSTNVFEFSFYNDTINTIGPENSGLPFFGRQDKNLMKTNMSTINKFHYTYILDKQNRVLQQTASSGERYIFTYY